MNSNIDDIYESMFETKMASNIFVTSGELEHGSVSLDVGDPDGGDANDMARKEPTICYRTKRGRPRGSKTKTSFLPKKIYVKTYFPKYFCSFRTTKNYNQ